MTAEMAGQRRLFGGVQVGLQLTRFTVSVFGPRRPWSTAFALVVAEARGVALAGQRAVVIASDGTAIEVRADAAGGFVIDTGPFPPAPWAEQARRLLADHG